MPVSGRRFGFRFAHIGSIAQPERWQRQQTNSHADCKTRITAQMALGRRHGIQHAA
jgi:hypothetical protein